MAHAFHIEYAGLYAMTLNLKSGFVIAIISLPAWLIYIWFSPRQAPLDLFLTKGIKFVQVQTGRSGYVDFPFRVAPPIEPWLLKKTVSFIDSNRNVLLVDTKTMETKPAIPLKNVLSFRVNCQNWVATTRREDNVELWKGSTTSTEFQKLDYHADSKEDVDSIDISSYGDMILIGSSRKMEWTLLDEKLDIVTSGTGDRARFTKGDDIIVSIGESSTSVINRRTNQPMISRSCFASALSPDRSVLVISSGSESRQMYFWRFGESSEPPSETLMKTNCISRISNAWGSEAAVSFDNSKVAIFGNELYYNPFGHYFVYENVYIYNIEKDHCAPVYRNWILRFDPSVYINSIFFAES